MEKVFLEMSRVREQAGRLAFLFGSLALWLSPLSKPKGKTHRKQQGIFSE